MKINVLLCGKLALDGYGGGCPKSDDGTFQMTVEEGATVQDILGSMDVPSYEVAMVRINGQKSQREAEVKDGDRIVLIPSEVASFWRYLGRLNLGWATPAA